MFCHATELHLALKTKLAAGALSQLNPKAVPEQPDKSGCANHLWVRNNATLSFVDLV